MKQTFTWTERDNGWLACAVLVDRGVFGWMWTPGTIATGAGLTGLEEQALDIQPWAGYALMTEDPLKGIP